jgi:hypothetical protein
VCVVGAGVGVLCEVVADFVVVSGLCRHRDSIASVAADGERFVQPMVRPVNGCLDLGLIVIGSFQLSPIPRGTQPDGDRV